MGQLSITAVVCVALTLFAVQVWFSHCWLKRFQYGPVEWLLRAVTTLSVPNLKRAEVRSPGKAGRAA